MTLTETLRPKRRELVRAAEQVAVHMFSGRKQQLKKSQLNHLISVCSEAECVDEIENYIRYQAARRTTGWSIELAKRVIDGPGPIIKDLDEASRREAWRLYAIFLTRAFTYHQEVARASSPTSRPAGRGGSHD